MRLVRAFKEASLHTKIFWIVSLGVGILTTALCLHPFLWFHQHRSIRSEEVKNK
jgi:hypothetical protein